MTHRQKLNKQPNNLLQRKTNFYAWWLHVMRGCESFIYKAARGTSLSDTSIGAKMGVILLILGEYRARLNFNASPQETPNVIVYHTVTCLFVRVKRIVFSQCLITCLITLSCYLGVYVSGVTHCKLCNQRDVRKHLPEECLMERLHAMVSNPGRKL